jgi:LemA protein
MQIVGTMGISRAMTLTLVALTLSASGCGYNQLQGEDEAVKAAWSEVQNQYQRRADLVPNLVATVKGEASFEQQTLQNVIEARAKATSIQATPELVNDPAAFQKFEAAQGELSSALSRLLVTVEKYPDLKANQAFRDLQAQLEGTENRIAVARKRYVDAVQQYNTMVRSFPTNLTAKYLLGLTVRPTFEARPGAEQPPEVKF